MPIVRSIVRAQLLLVLLCLFVACSTNAGDGEHARFRPGESSSDANVDTAASDATPSTRTPVSDERKMAPMSSDGPSASEPSWPDLDAGVGCTTPVKTARRVSTGWAHTCGLRDDGTVSCWGDMTAAPPCKYTSIDTHSNTACGLRADGSVDCWGLFPPLYPPEPPPPRAPNGIRFTQIAAGGGYACGLEAAGDLHCWHGPDFFDVGQADVPQGRFAQVSTGEGWHSCGIRTDGVVVCWGQNNYGQARPPASTCMDSIRELGHGGPLSPPTPVPVSTCVGDARFVSVSPGGNHTCGLRHDGEIECWGWNYFGQSTPATGSFQAVSSGASFTCAIDSASRVACWGVNNSEHQSGPPSGTFRQISSGGNHSCGVRTNGSVACWGSNGFGEATPPSDFP